MAKGPGFGRTFLVKRRLKFLLNNYLWLGSQRLDSNAPKTRVENIETIFKARIGDFMLDFDFWQTVRGEVVSGSGTSVTLFARSLQGKVHKASAGLRTL